VITRLRAAWITGPHHPALLHYLRGGGARACGFAHHWVQAIHEAELIAALRLAIREDLPGVYHVAPDGGLPLGEAAMLFGEHRACVSLARLLLEAWWGWRWRGQPTPPAWVMSLYHSHPLEAVKLREAGWSPAYGTRAALAAGLGPQS
jgi:hypothetical protein